jgi:hypothetical protein
MQKFIRAATVLAVTVALGAPSGALAFSNGGGNSGSAPGQENAISNCDKAIAKQISRGVQSGGGPKSSEAGPLNCDHFWQNNGAIGGGS